jgi:hypothetical protein
MSEMGSFAGFGHRHLEVRLTPANRHRMARLCKTVIALLAVASVGLAAPTMALARGGGGGGGHGGGAFRGGTAFHDGGFRGDESGRGFDRGRGFGHDRDFGRRFGFGFGGYYPYDNYAYDDSYYDDGNCYVVQQRVHTTHGWRLQPVRCAVDGLL